MSPALAPLIITIPLIAFWIWMFYDMVNNDKIPSNQRNLWLIGFIFLSLITAGYYYFTIYRERG